jgi:hypothetical protein
MSTVAPSGRLDGFMGGYTGGNVLGFMGPPDALAVHGIGPKEGDISKEVEKHTYITPVYVYHNVLGLTEKEVESVSVIDINDIFKKLPTKRLPYKVKDENVLGWSDCSSIDKFLESYIEQNTRPFDKNFSKNFPFAVTIKSKRYVLSLDPLDPLETINNPDGTYKGTVVLNYVKTLFLSIENGKINYVNLPLSDFKHISLKKKKASPNKKKVSSKKRASPKKRASQNKKALPNAKKASQKKNKYSR